MKQILILILVFSCSFSGMANAYDTIYVNEVKNSYLVFDNEVLIVDLGTRGDYVHRVESNVVFIKAITKAGPSTTLFVKSGENVFVGIVCYKKDNQKHLYDFRRKKLFGKTNAPSLDIPLVEKRLFSLKDEKDRFNRIRKKKDRIVFSLENLKTDQHAIYLKLRLKNKSALVYKVESITVENAEFYKKRFLSRNKISKIPVTPIVEGNISDVAPYSSQNFYLAVPVYAVGKQGAVYVTVRETSGVRSLTLEIKPKRMSKANLF